MAGNKNIKLWSRTVTGTNAKCRKYGFDDDVMYRPTIC